MSLIHGFWSCRYVKPNVHSQLQNEEMASWLRDELLPWTEAQNSSKPSLWSMDDGLSITLVVWKWFWITQSCPLPPQNLRWEIKHLNYKLHQYVQRGRLKPNLFRHSAPFCWTLIAKVPKIHKLGIYCDFHINELTKSHVLWYEFNPKLISWVKRQLIAQTCQHTFFLFSFFLRQKADWPTPKHRRRLTTWQVFHQV